MKEQAIQKNKVNDLKNEDLKAIYNKAKKDLRTLNQETLTTLAKNGFDVKEALFEKVIDNDYEADDEVLAYMTREGDDTARNILAEKYVDFVRVTVLRLIRNGIYNKGYEAEDLIQSGYIGFLNAIGDFKIEMNKPFRVFTHYVVRRYINSLISRSNNNKLRTLNDSFSIHSQINEDSDTTFEQLLKSEGYLPEDHLVKLETFYELWDILSETEKSVLLYYADDYSYEEIGEIVFKESHPDTKRRIKAVDNTIQRINKKRDNFLRENYGYII